MSSKKQRNTIISSSTLDNRICVAKDFSETPGPRSIDEGPYSGEDFLKEILLPKYLNAKARREVLFIDLDETEGYATSFLESAFGGLARLHPKEDVIATLKFKSEEEPYLIEEIKQYILEA